MVYKTTSLTMSNVTYKLEKNVPVKRTAIEKKNAVLIAKKKLAIKNKQTKCMKLSVPNNTNMKNTHDKRGLQDKKRRLAWSNVMKCGV